MPRNQISLLRFGALLCTLLFFTSLHAHAEDETPTPTRMPVLTLRSGLVEVRDPLAIFGTPGRTLRETIEWIDAAATDDSVGAIAVRIETPMLRGAHAAELHSRLMAFRETGKPVVASFDTATLNTYLLASAADKVVISPSGGLGIAGVAAHLYYMRDLLGKLGVEAQVIAAGEFKNALEPLAEQEMSETTREQTTAMIEALADYYASAVAAGRGMTTEDAAEALWGGPYTATGAREARLVDAVDYPDEFFSQFARERSLSVDRDYRRRRAQAQPPSLMSLFTGGASMRARRGAATPGHVAVIYALGNIVDGRESEDPFFRANVIAAESFVELIDEAVREPNIKALVVRIDSGGGSAIASDRIWRRLERVREEQQIPVIASMGGMAASGGYYIAMAADEIIAAPNTITGSIGVVGGRLVLGDLYDKIGVNKQMIGVGPNIGVLDETTAWEGSELEIIERLIAETYDTFVAKAAESRGLSIDEMDKLAQGRVWIADADTPLVDRIGGLGDAIARARELADADDAAIIEYPKEKTFFELLDDLMSGSMGISAMAAPRGVELMRIAPGVREALPAPFAHSLMTTLWLLHQDQPAVLMIEPAFIEIR